MYILNIYIYNILQLLGLLRHGLELPHFNKITHKTKEYTGNYTGSRLIENKNIGFVTVCLQILSRWGHGTITGTTMVKHRIPTRMDHEGKLPDPTVKTVLKQNDSLSRYIIQTPPQKPNSGFSIPFMSFKVQYDLAFLASGIWWWSCSYLTLRTPEVLFLMEPDGNYTFQHPSLAVVLWIYYSQTWHSRWKFGAWNWCSL